MDNVITEVLIKEEKEIKLLRVLLKFDLFLRYPKFGVWSYLINTKSGVVVFDTGPKFNAIFPIFNFLSRKTGNADIIIETLEKYFPNKTIKEILISHYHFDHSQAAPELQEKIFLKFGNLPPIRLHKKELEKKKIFYLYPTSLVKTFRQAGFKKWHLGKSVEDGERIEGTDFIIKHSPGHTSGTIALVNEKYKIIIAGLGIAKDLKFYEKATGLISDEDKKSYPKTLKNFQKAGYKYFYLHPRVGS